MNVGYQGIACKNSKQGRPEPDCFCLAWPFWQATSVQNFRTSTLLNCLRISFFKYEGAQWLSGRVLDSRPRGRGFKPHRRHLSKNIHPSLVLVQPRKTCPFITERLLMGRKESNQTKFSNMRRHCISHAKRNYYK